MSIVWQGQLEPLLNVGVCGESAIARALNGLVLSPHSHRRIVLIASLDNSTDVFCSNGVVGIQEDDICCAAECGRCGGSRCGQLPGGPVRWCLAIFVS